MPLVVDPIVLDPADFLPNGAELDLSGAGFRVLDANFGDADVELELQRQALGEVPTTYHPPNTVTTLALGVRAEEEIDLPTAAHQLAAKVGEINTPGTEHWLRRDFEVGGDFAGSLGKRAYKATLSGLGAWQRGESPDVVLTLVTGPYWYATLEQESAVFESEAGARDLIFELAEVLGTSPGLIRIRIKNTGEEDLRALIFAGESRDMAQDESADTTAAMAYDAADLTPKGGAEVKTVEGVEVVEHASLTAGWLSIMNSKIAAEELGHMTHIGVRRFWVRVEAVEGELQLHLRWRALGSTNWTDRTMPIVPLGVVGDYQLYDLGECRPEPAALGDQRWEWDLQARAVSGSGKVRLHQFYPLPTEQFCVVKAPAMAQAADGQQRNSPGTVEDKEGVGTKAWSNAGNAKASDDSRATALLEPEQSTHYLKATNFGFALPAGATVVGIIAEVELSEAPGDNFIKDHSVRIVKGGAIGEVDKSSAARWGGPSDIYRSYGSASDLWGETWDYTDINSTGFGFAISAFAILGREARIDHIRITVYYTEAADPNVICAAGRSVEYRSDGVYRQDPTEEVWGLIVPGGFLPYSAPSGLEGRKSRFIVIPSQGNLGELPDSGDNSLSGQEFDRPGYLYSREAA